MGPLLCSLFVNDIPASLRYSQHVIFADNYIYLNCLLSEIETGLARIAHDVEVIGTYARDSGVVLNLAKSKIFIQGSSAFISWIVVKSLPPIIVNGTRLPCLNQVRSLGVVVFSNLSWRGHIMSISRRVHFLLQRLKFHRSTLSVWLRTTLPVSLMLDYSYLVNDDLTCELNGKLQCLISCGIRFILNLRREEHISSYRRRLGWLTVESRRPYFLEIMTYKILHGKAPGYLLELFSRSIPPQHPSRRITPTVFLIPDFRTTIYRNSFYHAGIYFWQSLPVSVVSSERLGVLKVGFFEHLFALDAGVGRGI